jgi:hypothetical protein
MTASPKCEEIARIIGLSRQALQKFRGKQPKTALRPKKRRNLGEKRAKIRTMRGKIRGGNRKI